jgi:hypothetical protein
MRGSDALKLKNGKNVHNFPAAVDIRYDFVDCRYELQQVMRVTVLARSVPATSYI